MKKAPIALGLFLCEKLIVEEKTRNVTLVNCFTHKTVEQFPAPPFPFVVFAILADGLGDLRIEVLVESLDNLDVICRREVPLQFTSPLQEARCMLRMTDCSFPEAGLYQVQLLASGESVAHCKVRILSKEGNP